MTFPSDVFESQDYRLDRFGFDRAAFMAALANKESDTSSKWSEGLRSREAFTVEEAACIIVGVHPDDIEYCDICSYPKKVSDMIDAIIEAKEELQIEMHQRGQERISKVTRTAITEWCERKGLEWPLKTLPQRKPDHTNTDPSYPVNQPQQDYSINSPAFDRLMQAIEAFPVDHPDYETKPPKQLARISWLNSKFVFGDKEREPRFIDKVIVDHFKLPR